MYIYTVNIIIILWLISEEKYNLFCLIIITVMFKKFHDKKINNKNNTEDNKK